MPADDKQPPTLEELFANARGTDVAPPPGAKESAWAMIEATVAGPPALVPAPVSAIRAAAIAGFAAGVLAGVVGTVAGGSLATRPSDVVYVKVPVEQVREVVREVAVSTPSAPSDERANERWWVEAARAAMSRGDFDAASSDLETAKLRFPNGLLAEERDALAVQLVIHRGDSVEASRALDEFRARHAGSIQIPVLERMLAQKQSD